jgi:hypothetical protein
MRTFIFKAPVEALLLASAATLFSILFIPVMNYLGNDVLFQVWKRFYFPADLAAFLCSSGDDVHMYVVDANPRPVLFSFPESLPGSSGFHFLFLLFALIQWYSIFLVALVCIRHFQRKKDKHESAV